MRERHNLTPEQRRFLRERINEEMHRRKSAISMAYRRLDRELDRILNRENEEES